MEKVYFILSLVFISINVMAQNVGIGTITPIANAKLEVTSSTNNQIVIYGANTGQAGYGVFGATSNGGIGVLGESYGGNASAYSVGGWFISDGSTNYALKAETLGNGTAAYFSSPSGNAVIVDQGNVGIAELAPTEKLHINNGNIKIGKTIWGSVADNKFLKFGDGDYVTIGEVGGDDRMEIKGRDITLRSSPAGFLPAGNVLIPNGNVGIGNNAPVAPLSFANVLGNRISLWTNSPTSQYGIGIQHGTFQFYTAGSDKMAFGYGSSTNFTETMSFYSGSGQLGIGTANVGSYKLAVNGNVRSKEVVVETGWADFVFDEKYKLPLLSDVEKFIKANKHLPNIPSAEEIQTNGLKVGEVQTKMMQKIEELTLYVIELEKRIELIKSTNNIKKQ